MEPKVLLKLRFFVQKLQIFAALSSIPQMIYIRSAVRPPPTPTSHDASKLV